MKPDGETLLPVGGYLRGLRLVFDGVATTGGPFYQERKRYRRAPNQQVRCPAVWDRRCQRRRGHDGMHWWGHRSRDAWWSGADYPFTVIDELQ